MDFPLNQKTVSRSKQLMVITKKDGICGYEKNGEASTSKGSGWEMFDAGIATQTFCLAAHAKGVGTVILGIFDDVPEPVINTTRASSSDLTNNFTNRSFSSIISENSRVLK